jgi:hypothetical protein
MREVVAAPVAVVDKPGKQLGVGRYPGAEPHLEPPAGQHVGHGQVLGQPERALIADRYDRRAEFDAPGALRRGGEEHWRGRHVRHQVLLAYPGPVEAKPFPVLEQPQGALETLLGIFVDEAARHQQRQRPDDRPGADGDVRRGLGGDDHR